ncbi:helix-turn-helix domain-containing protein [Streptomyces xiaopingdaonensis]|uniref:helix-turn-helix domain-containing protein n=1 Tax=Streptomyces xiaopingdaonensis TaxID=1565415 RepID=UPI000493F98C|nr:helix-turn-helix transcriptional regulator [Streptomyces xiaopingdaonensis]
MAPRSRPSQRQRRLGLEMRRLREAAGMTTEAAAKLLDVPRTNIPNMESGRSGVSSARVRALAFNYGCTDTGLVSALSDMAVSGKAGWWDQYHGHLPTGFLDVAELEHHAESIRFGLTVHLPGLLQTEAHARVVFGLALPQFDSVDVEARVQHRLDRQTAWFRRGTQSLEVVLHEAAVRMQFGGRSTAKEQLRRLLEVSEDDRAAIYVIPFHAGAFRGAGQSVTYFEESPHQLDTVALDTSLRAEFLSEPTQLAAYRAQLDSMKASSLGRRSSQEFIAGIERDM